MQQAGGTEPGLTALKRPRLVLSLELLCWPGSILQTMDAFLRGSHSAYSHVDPWFLTPRRACM